MFTFLKPNFVEYIQLDHERSKANQHWLGLTTFYVFCREYISCKLCVVGLKFLTCACIVFVLSKCCIWYLRSSIYACRLDDPHSVMPSLLISTCHCTNWPRVQHNCFAFGEKQHLEHVAYSPGTGGRGAYWVLVVLNRTPLEGVYIFSKIRAPTSLLAPKELL